MGNKTTVLTQVGGGTFALALVAMLPEIGIEIGPATSAFIVIIVTSIITYFKKVK